MPPIAKKSPEERALEALVDSKKLVLAALNRLGELYTGRGETVVGITDSITWEQTTLEGYERALANHRKLVTWEAP